MRLIDADARSELLAQLNEVTAERLRRLLSVRAGSAAGLVDPNVVTLREHHTVEQALELFRQSGERGRFNLPVIDGEQRLVGVLNLQELIAAAPGRRIGAVMHPAVEAVKGTSEAANVLRHPAWQWLHQLPVVDGDGTFLGIIRYRDIRSLEQQIREAESSGASSTVEALGEIFRAGAGGVLEALGGAHGAGDGR